MSVSSSTCGLHETALPLLCSESDAGHTAVSQVHPEAPLQQPRLRWVLTSMPCALMPAPTRP